LDYFHTFGGVKNQDDLKNNWWKFLAVLIMLYVIIAGFLVPLRPGIQSSSPSTARCSQLLTLDVTGYNTHWSASNADLRAWLKFDDDHIISAERISQSSDRNLTAVFQMPQALPVDKNAIALTLIVDHEVDGPCILPTAVVLTKGNLAAGNQGWSESKIDNLHFKKSFAFPYRNILFETIRNTYFHVPLWMSMYALLALATYLNIKYLRTGDDLFEERAYHLTLVSLLFGTLGIATGMIWAHFTWGRFWSWDIKQTMALLAMLMFVAYVFIRFSIPDETARRRFNAVYGIFAFVMIFPLLYIVPRMAPSLHPGSGGNPAFGSEDMDNTMRMVFYPAIIGYFLIGLWLAQLSNRVALIKRAWLLKN
jgi:heme exporter protein C